MGRRSEGDLDTLQDPARMQAIFQTYLRAASAAAIAVQSCSVDYIQQSPMRCVLQYTLGIADPMGGESLKQVVTAVSYGPERTRELWSEVAADPEATTPIDPLSLLPISYVPEIDALIQVFPHDYRLPGLRRLLADPAALAQPILAEAGPGAWQPGRWGTEVVRYRPDTRAMVRLTLQAQDVADGRTATLRAYAKIYHDAQEGERARCLLQVLWEQTAAQDADFVVARPLAYVPEQRLLLLSEIPGTRLLEVMRQAGDVDAPIAMRRAARAVAGFHQLSLPEGLLPAAKRDRHARLTEVAAALSQRDPEHAAAIAEVIAAVAAGFGEPLLAPTHFDLKLGHMLLEGERVALLDFDKMALGDPLVDVANVIATLSQEREKNPQEVARRAGLAKTFVQEYFTHVPSSWRAQFPARYALAALADAATTGRGLRGRSRRPDQNRRITASIARARQALAGELW